MSKFDPRSLSKETLDKAVRDGRLADYYLDDNTLVKEISTNSGGYVLKLIEYVDSTKKKHIQMDFVYDSTGKLINSSVHNSG